MKTPLSRITIPLHRIQRSVEERGRERVMRGIYAKFRGQTMISERTYITNLRIADRVRNVAGAVVECGVWRGGMIAGIADLLGPERTYILVDSFQGLPPAKAVDGPAAMAWQADAAGPQYYDNCSASIEETRATMERSAATNCVYLEGWFEKVLPTYQPPGPIALLRLDGDWYDSTLACLQALAGHVCEGGSIIIDDYYTWDGCARAVHDFISKQANMFRISQIDNDVCTLMVLR